MSLTIKPLTVLLKNKIVFLSKECVAKNLPNFNVPAEGCKDDDFHKTIKATQIQTWI
jgi:hypothetical protein